MMKLENDKLSLIVIWKSWCHCNIIIISKLMYQYFVWPNTFKNQASCRRNVLLCVLKIKEIEPELPMDLIRALYKRKVLSFYQIVKNNLTYVKSIGLLTV